MRKKNQVLRGQHVISRRDLKPQKELSDAELLADAIRSAEEWQQSKKKNNNY